MSSMRQVTIRAGIITGIVGGTVFFLHALIPRSGTYPFIWPLLTGAAAYWRVTRDAAPAAAPAAAAAPGRVGRGVQATVVAALLVGLIAWVGSTVTVAALSRPVLSPIAQSYGASASDVTSTAARAVAMVALVAAGLTVLGGAVVLPVRLLLWPSSRAKSPAA